MLTELLDTRVMVKQAMKSVGGDKVSLLESISRTLDQYLGWLGSEENLGCSSTRSEIHCQRYIWLYWRNVFGENARSRDC